MVTITAPNTETTRLKTKIPDTTIFIITLEFNNFDARIKEAPKSLTSKIQVDNVPDIADKKKEKTKKLQTFDLRYFFGKSHFENNKMQCFSA